MRRGVEELVGGPGFSADDVVRAGRSAVRRRRAAGVSAVAALAALVTAGAYAALPDPEAVGPVVPPATHAPAPPSPRPTPPAPPRTALSDLGIAAYAGNTVVGPERQRVELPFPADEVATVARVPDAWVVETATGLWYLPEDGDPDLIGQLGTPVLSAEGDVLIASTRDGTAMVVAVALPSLEELGRTTFDTGVGPIAVGVVDGLVLLRGAQGGPGPSQSAVWDLATGTARPAATDAMWLWGVSRDGDVLRRVDERGGDNPKEITAACIDVVPVADTVSADLTGWCGEDAGAMFFGSISPDGAWVYLGSGDPAVPDPGLIAAADLRAGDWRPIPTEQGRPVLWDTDMTFLAEGSPQGGYVRCDTTGHCEPVVLPAELGPDALLVQVYGG